MSIFCGGALLILLKKFIGLKFLQWFGWKRMYRLMHREGLKIMRDQPQRKKDAFKRLRKLHYKSMRKTFDFVARHPTLIGSVAYADRAVTNALLYVPRKLKLGLHRWIGRELELQSKRRRNDPMFKLPKQWYGPLMLNEQGMVGVASMYLLSRYLWIAMHENHAWFNVAFVLSNREYIGVINEEIQQRWRDNPHEYERKQYVNILKKSF